MTSVAGDNQVDTQLQQSYLNDRCAYLTEQLARHNADIARSALTCDDVRTLPVSKRERRMSAKVSIHFDSCEYVQHGILCGLHE